MIVSRVMIIGYVMGPSWRFEENGSKHAGKRVLITFFFGVSHAHFFREINYG